MNAANSLAPDVLVVGAGPVGLTAAAELTRHGAKVRIVDKRTGPVEYSQAAAVHVRMLEILNAMGIAGDWVAAGQPFTRMRIRAFGKKIGVVHLDGIDSPYPSPFIVGQNVTEKLLVEHLSRLGVTVERQVEATPFSQDDAGVNVTLHHLATGGDEEAVRVPWVVACEGSASKAREAVGIAFDGAPYTGEEFVQADVRLHWTYPNGDGYVFMETDRVLVFFPFDREGNYRVLCGRREQPGDPSEAAGHAHEPPTLEEMQAIAREMTADPALWLSDPVWLNRFRTQHRLAGSFRAGRIFIAGDSGHVHVPIGGQGMNYGIQDAFNLAWKLATVIRGDAGPEPLLDSYNAERHAVDTELLHGTDKGYHAMVGSGTLKELAIRFAGPVAIGLDVVQEQIRTMLSGTRIHYRGGALIADHGGSGGPAAGDRAPDAKLVRFADRETIQLFDLFYPGGNWTLLLFGGLDLTGETCAALAQISEAVVKDFGRLIKAYLVFVDPTFAGDVEPGSLLVDREHMAHDEYGVKGACIYLVRPDGHVGYRSPAKGGGEGRLAAYLDTIGLLKA
jgi:2-polyprenyl-6-methoxyphenol hydroxylase-like FAD-dependent oxidoreductase